jgi:membrane protease YdiL (CAAX protease family)
MTSIENNKIFNVLIIMFFLGWIGYCVYKNDELKNVIIKTFKYEKSLLIIGVIFFLLYSLLSIIIKQKFFPFFSENQTQLNKLRKQQPYYFLISTIFYAPINEELCFRYLIFRYFKPLPGFLISAISFAAVHVFYYYDWSNFYGYFFSVGIIFSLLLLINRDNILYSIAFHASWNFLISFVHLIT